MTSANFVILYYQYCRHVVLNQLLPCAVLLGQHRLQKEKKKNHKTLTQLTRSASQINCMLKANVANTAETRGNVV